MTPPGYVVLITGGSRGIGYATARAFLGTGARVALLARESARLADAAKQLRSLGEVMTYRADVRQASEVQAAVDTVLARYGAVDVLVNNAGVAWTGAFAEQERASIDAIVDINLKGVLQVTRAVLPLMLRQGHGVVINVASGAGRTGFAGLASYCASKFGVVGFTESLAAEVRDAGVRVYAVCPGAVATDMQREVSGIRAGMAPERVATKIVALAGTHPPIAIGGCVEDF
jgi:3-oxoacyl-[acyl-carrier protein] reductase